MYHSYLLRLRRVEAPGDSWRAMLQSVTEPGEQHYFKDMESLAAYLAAASRASPPVEGEA